MSRLGAAACGAAGVAGLAAGYALFMAPGCQLFGAYPHRVRTAEPVVALTFDDGPNEPYTSQLLDYLDSRRIRATFFQVGRCVERFPDTTARMVAAGHVVGNHSLTHRFGTYLRPGRYAEEVRRTQEILVRHAGRTPALARSPWLWRHPALLRTLRAAGLRPVSGVFCHPLEVLQISAAAIARAAVAKTGPGTILIFHDGFDARGGDRGQTVAAVRRTVEALSARGFRFVTVDELLGVPAYR
ncbi:polysaccharide deacetylase family protein [Plantactinospora siamensis]|uniref:Polysaccharide deacetylase family protein n=1 Tax=Plantactinospora siamensis TaxID=555372 RepID=A0ABV6P083_9ACTN